MVWRESERRLDLWIRIMAATVQCHVIAADEAERAHAEPVLIRYIQIYSLSSCYQYSESTICLLSRQTKVMPSWALLMHNHSNEILKP